MESTFYVLFIRHLSYLLEEQYLCKCAVFLNLGQEFTFSLYFIFLNIIRSLDYSFLLFIEDTAIFITLALNSGYQNGSG